MPWRRIHKWSAIAAGVFLLSWITSGVMISLPRQLTGPEAHPDAPIALSEIRVSPAEVAARMAPGSEWIGLKRVGGAIGYEVRSEDGGRQLIDARTGSPLAMTRQLAEEAVRTRFPAITVLTGASLLDRNDSFYRSGSLPAWRLSFAGDSSAAYYVSTQTGEVQRIDRWRQIQSGFGRLHDFSALEIVFPGLAIRPWVLYFGCAAGLAASLTGYYLALLVRRRPQS